MSIVFYFIAGLSVAGALAAVLLKNTVHCALALTLAFAGLALLFLQLDAQFAGFAQILVYIGAVAILVVFAILLTRGSETPQNRIYSRNPFVGLATAAAIFAVLGWAVLRSSQVLPGSAGIPPVSIRRTIWMEAEKSAFRTGPSTATGLTTASSSAPPSSAMKFHAARSASVFDFTYAAAVPSMFDQ